VDTSWSPLINMRAAVCFLFLVVCPVNVQARGVGADPSSGWLSYAVYNAPKPSDVITKLSASMIVPDAPSGHFGSPAFWFGVQTQHGDGALIQPIMSKWLIDGFYMFQEIFDWTNEQDEQSRQIKVKPGHVIQASVTYVKGPAGTLGSYAMNMTNENTGQRSDYSYTLLPQQKATESVAYFVLEHQPDRCAQLPPNGNVTWTDIQVEVNGMKVVQPKFVATQEEPKCDSKAIVIDSSTVSITWSP